MPSRRIRIGIVGAGGLAREIAWLLRDLSASPSGAGPGYELAGFLVSEAKYLVPNAYGMEVRGDFNWLEAHRDEFDALALAIGLPRERQRLVAELDERLPQVLWPTLVHPSVRADFATLELRRGAILSAGVTASVNVSIGEFAMINYHCTVGHEARLGRCCGLNPAANISGGVSVGEAVLVGTGSQILAGVTVGSRSIVGAGALVIQDVPEGVTVAGVPARIIARE